MGQGEVPSNFCTREINSSVCVCGVSHENLEGGELLVYENQQAEPCFKMEIKDGMFALINDRQVWHNATPMNKIDARNQFWLYL